MVEGEYENVRSTNFYLWTSFEPHLLLSSLLDDVKVLRRGVEVGVGVEQVRHKRQVQLLVAIFDVL